MTRGRREAALTESSPQHMPTRSDDRRLIVLALGIATGIHLSVLFLVVLPEFHTPVVVEEPSPFVPEITSTRLPPPPAPEPPRPEDRALPERLAPVPEPVPDRPEPVAEPAPERADLAFAPPPPIHEQLGSPEPPPATEPYDATDAAILPPRLIAASKAAPHYPEAARLSRIEGRVTLRATIDEDGTVRELRVTGCNRPGLGFEEAAIRAVSQWRYVPARRADRAVPVYLAVEVRFTLR